MKKIMLLFLLSSFCFSGYDPATFIQNGIGVRASSMGKAFVSILSDPSSVYYNPAGISASDKIMILFSSDLLTSSPYETLKNITPNYQNFSFILPLKTFNFLHYLENPVIGVGFINYSLEHIPLTTIEYFNYEDFYISRDEMTLQNNAYLLNFSDRISILNLYYGFGFRVITQNFTKIEDGNSIGYDFVLGAVYSITDELNLGILVTRGIYLKWSNGEEDRGPFSVNCGISNKFFIFKNLSLLLSIDFIQKQKYPFLCNLGLESEIGFSNGIIKNIYLRTGVENFVLENRYEYQNFFNKTLNFSTGIGIKIYYNGLNFLIDYMLGFYNLGNKHKISLGVIF